MLQDYLPGLLSYPEKAVILADNDMFIRALSELGLDAAAVDSTEPLPAQSLVFSFTSQGARQFYERAARTRGKQSILCPLHAFDPGLENALYSLMLLLRSDFAKCLRRQREHLRLLSQHQRLYLASEGSRADVWLKSRSSPYVTTHEDISEPFVLSVSELFEVHYAHMRPDSPDLFQLNGILRISGLLISQGRHRTPHATGADGQLLELSQRVARHQAWLHIEHNQVRSLKVAGQEYVGLLSRAAGDRGLYLSEFAIGVNDAIRPNINYSHNSPMNEGVSGVHVGLGDGASGYHIDFLSPGVEVLPR